MFAFVLSWKEGKRDERSSRSEAHRTQNDEDVQMAWLERSERSGALLQK